MKQLGIMVFCFGVALGNFADAKSIGNLAAYGIGNILGNFNSLSDESLTSVDISQQNQLQSPVTPTYTSFVSPHSPTYVTGFLDYYFAINSVKSSILSAKSSQEQSAYFLVKDGGDTMLVVGGKEGAIELFSATTGALVRDFTYVGTAWITCFAMFQHNGQRYLIAGDMANTINVYNFDTGLLVQSIKAFAQTDASSSPPWVVDMVVFQNNETIKILANGFAHEVNNKGSLASFNPLTGEKYYETICASRRDYSNYNSGQTYGMVLYKQGEAAELAIAVSNPDYVLKIYNPISGETVRQLQDPQISAAQAQPSEVRAFKSKGVIKLAVGYFNGYVGIWNTQSGQLEYFAQVLKRRQMIRGISIFYHASEAFGVITGGDGLIPTYQLDPLQFRESLDVNPKRDLVSTVAHQQDLVTNQNEFAVSHSNISLGDKIPNIDLNIVQIIRVHSASSSRRWDPMLEYVKNWFQ